LSRAGLGITWVPQSLVRPDLHANRLTDLSAVLPSVPANLLVRRLAGPKTAVEEDLWSVFSSGTFRT
jgi:DNA-binding transcriptional LysR family regulator